MLRITIPATEEWNETTEEFIYTKEQTLQLEHSLVSLSKWESRWKKPFLSKEVKTKEEIIDYIKCMTVTQNVDPNVYRCLTEENIKAVNAYINDPMTATTFSDRNKRSPSREIITSEILYYQMIALTIPMECQKWHLNRLLTLIRVCDLKNQKPKKQSMRERYTSNAALNAARRKQLNSKG